MSQLSKQALKVGNQTSFPNNTTNYITPAILRDFNVDMIDSLVDENTYNADSASWNTAIDNLEQFSSSLDTNFASQTEFNSYTQSTNVSINALNNTTASTNTSITNLNSATASLNASASLGLVTASFNNGTRNLTFTKGNNDTFSVNIPDVSGSSGNFATTGSNTFTGNQTVSGYVSASLGFQSGPNTTALLVGDGANVRFSSGSDGSQYYNVQLVPGVGDLAFSRSGASNVKTFVLGGVAGNNTSFQNNPVVFQSSVGSVTLSTPLAINSGVNSNVDITGSLKISSTFDAPLTQGYVWVGASNGRTTTVATSSFATSTDLTPLNAFTASQFVSNSYFATTGSNTFVGVEAINYVSGSGTGEVYLLSNSGSLVIGNSTSTPTYAALSFISSSQVNGNTNLIFKTNTNAQSLTISGSANLFVPPTAPSAEFKRYIGGSGNIILLASAVPQITGSNQISPSFTNNIHQGSGFFMRTPVSSSTWTISGNSFNNFGNINLGTAAATPFVSASAGVTISNNFIAGTISSTAYKATLYGPVGIIQSYVGGTLTMNNDSSSTTLVNSIQAGALTINNSYNAGTTTNANGLAFSAGNAFMGTNNLINASGSNTTTSVQRQIQSSALIGSAHTASVVLNGDNSHLSSTALIGHSLVVTGSSAATTTAVTGSDRGTVIVGRFNADVQSGNTVFAVGAGTSVLTRKNALLIDSGSNIVFSGSLFVQSGSASFPSATGSALLAWNATTGQITNTTYQSALPALFDAGAFYSTGSITTTANTSGSFQFDTSLNINSINVTNGSRVNIPKTGTYNFQFSIQIQQGAGAGNIAVWLKKNGNNVADTATYIVVPSNQTSVLALNLWDNATIGDYYEIAYQSDSNATSFTTVAASGNIPRSPAIILTVNQIR